MGDPLQRGSEYGEYRIERRLATGGMGEIYLACQPRLGRRVVLKRILSDLANDDQFRARFEREAKHVASLDHQNVVPLFDAGEIDGDLFMAMRFVDGRDLDALRNELDRIDAADAASITGQVASALDAAHAIGLIHRDVKPSNILLAGGTPDGHVYLTDFGITKDAAARSRLTNTGHWVGTIDYVAPEQIESGSVLDARTDVYALSCVLYEMLAGRPPFAGGDPQKIWAKMNGEKPPPLENGQLARAFGPAIARGTALEPADRFPSAGDLGRATLAAASGRANTVPERSVATGAAATGLRQTVDERSAHAAPTREAPARPPEPPTRPTKDMGRSNGGSRRILGRSNGGSRRLLVGLGIVAALVVGAAAAALVTVGLSGDDEPTTVAEEDGAAGDTTVTETTTGEENATLSAAPARYRTYLADEPGFGYFADLPAGNGWSRPVETRPYDSALLRSTVRGPDGMFVLVDRTPDDAPEFSGEFDSSREIPSPASGPPWTEYVFSESESFPECDGSTCVDYLIEDGRGGGFAVLAGGPDLPLAKEVATTVRKSIHFGE